MTSMKVDRSAGPSRLWRVGQVARAARTTVRTLHHYEACGLLSPVRDSSSGHRLYRESDVRRLQKVQLLHRLGLSLAEIRPLLEETEVSLIEVLRLHRERLAAQARRIRGMLDRLDGLDASMSAGRSATIEDVFSLLEAMMAFEKYYTREQLEELERRRAELGEDGMRRAQEEWQTLIADVQSAVAEGLDPESEEAAPLVRRWNAMIEQFTGGSEGIRQSLDSAYAAEPQAWERFGISPAMRDWVQRASEADRDRR